jgi:serine/threonine protein kinase
MDYCPHDLFYLLASSHAPSTSDGAIDCYFSQLLHGVGYLHQVGIAHLDLKLENCVVAPNGILKIIDFGCAEVVRAPWEMRNRQCEKAKGSQPYVAPEVYRSAPFNGQEADAWAVGIMFVCMVERHYPWRMARPSADDSYRRYSEMRNVADATEEVTENKMAKLATAATATGGEQSEELSLQAGSKEQRPHSLPPVTNGNITSYMRNLLPARPEAWRLVSGLLTTQPSRRWTIAQALDDPWARQIETCHAHRPAVHHRHVGCESPLIK